MRLRYFPIAQNLKPGTICPVARPKTHLPIEQMVIHRSMRRLYLFLFWGQIKLRPGR